VIEGVKVKKLKVIPDERGRLMEILRSDDDVFEKFGQCYCTTVRSGVVKAWHYHEKQSDNFAVVSGMAKVGLYDGREDSPTNGEVMEIFAGIHNPVLIHIPPMVRHGFKGIGEGEAVIVNCPTELYNYEQPDELRVDPHGGEIPYDWAQHDG
jgi:dTDP-4-dehydrorhamnose 3,5-epimerase